MRTNTTLHFLPSFLPSTYLLLRRLYQFIEDIIPLVSHLLGIESQVDPSSPLEVDSDTLLLVRIGHRLGLLRWSSNDACDL